MVNSEHARIPADAAGAEPLPVKRDNVGLIGVLRNKIRGTAAGLRRGSQALMQTAPSGAGLHTPNQFGCPGVVLQLNLARREQALVPTKIAHPRYIGDNLDGLRLGCFKTLSGVV